SISIQPYPVSNPAAIDEAAEAQVAELKAQVEAVRALRGEMNLSPGQRVPLIARGDRAVLERNSEYLKSLARLEGVEIVDTLPQLGGPVQIGGPSALRRNPGQGDGPAGQVAGRINLAAGNGSGAPPVGGAPFFSSRRNQAVLGARDQAVVRACCQWARLPSWAAW